MKNFSSLGPGDSFWIAGVEYKKTEPTKRSNAVNVESGTKSRFGAIAQVSTTNDEPTRRQARYGKLARGWDWRTEPELLERADKVRGSLNMTRTEFLETAIKYLIEKVGPA